MPTPESIIRTWGIRALFAAALLWSFTPLAGDYGLRTGALMLVYTTLALGLTILPGFCGLLDLGYVAFYALGAYVCGLATVHYELSFWLILPLAAFAGALWGTLLGAPTLRLSGDYFALVVFGFAELVGLVLTNEVGITRGPLGLPGIDPPLIDLTALYRLMGKNGGELSLDDPRAVFLLGLGMTAAAYVVVKRVEDSPLGRDFLALKEDEWAARACGVHPVRTRTAAFALSAGIGAVAGAFLARTQGFISPNMFTFNESFLILTMVVLGGLGNPAGAMLGAAALVGLGEGLRAFLPLVGLPAQSRFLLYGLVMILVMRFKPAGLLPRRPARAALPDPPPEGALPWRRS